MFPYILNITDINIYTYIIIKTIVAVNILILFLTQPKDQELPKNKYALLE